MRRKEAELKEERRNLKNLEEEVGRRISEKRLVVIGEGRHTNQRPKKIGSLLLLFFPFSLLDLSLGRAI